jgi:hypothetical protein
VSLSDSDSQFGSEAVRPQHFSVPHFSVELALQKNAGQKNALPPGRFDIQRIKPYRYR